MTWHETTWERVCTLHYGKALKNYKRFNENYPVFGSGGVVGSTKEPLSLPKSVVVARKGTLTVYWSEKPCYVIDTAYWLEPKQNLDSKWAYFALKELDISNLSSGSAVPSLSIDDFYQTPVNIPSLFEQKVIADILGSLDDKIELNHKMNETLEGIAKTIFKSWFVDFDPVRAKMEGRPTGLPPEISALFPDELVNSELGEIPKGWKILRMEQLCEFQNGCAFKSKDWNEHGTIPVVKIGNVKPMLVDVDSCSMVSSDVVEGLERFKLLEGDILIGMTGYVGEVGIVPKRVTMPYLNQRVGRIIPIKEDDYAFVLTFCRDRKFKTNVENLATGSAQANISASDIKNLKLVVPFDELRHSFNKIAKLLFQRILLSNSEANHLAQLRDTLLPRLISGRLRIPDADRLLKEAGL